MTVAMERGAGGQRVATVGHYLRPGLLQLQALPPLANVYRYGSVRQTDTALLATVIDSLVLRAAIGLPVACMAMDEDAAAAMKQKLLAAHDALRLRGCEQPARQIGLAHPLARQWLAIICFCRHRPPAGGACSHGGAHIG